MNWQSTLIRVFLFVQDRFGLRLYALAQRQSNNNRPAFTDEEVLTIYLFGLMQQRRTIRAIHTYAADHFPEWFPELPSYGGYVDRLNRLSAVFAPLGEAAIGEVMTRPNAPGTISGEILEAMRLVDSFPIVMAGPKRSAQARVAPELADKGYCASKNLYFYGVKLHVVALSRPGTLPVPNLAGLSAGSANDLTVLREALPTIYGGNLFGDKAYVNQTLRTQMIKEQNLEILTPIKKAKGQKRLSAADRFYSEAVSRSV
jgi:hypothetical protein